MPDKLPITIYWRIMGGHVHMRVFIRGALIGNLIVNQQEFESMRSGEYSTKFEEDRH